jgi:Fur family ferric uptake transcriptional regulator
MTARPTRQRGAVQAVVAELDGFHSAQDIHARLRLAGEPIGLATVYRTVAALAADGELDVLRTERGETLYRRCSTGHHHHLRCRGCGRTVEVDGPIVESWADRVATDHGFAEVIHTLEIIGICADCASARLPGV